MPYENIGETCGVVQRFCGFVSAGEYVASAAEVASDARFDDLKFVISDDSRVDAHRIGKGTLDIYAALRIGATRTNPNIRAAFIVTRSELRTIVELLTSPQYAAPQVTRVFARLTEAREWLSSRPTSTSLNLSP